MTGAKPFDIPKREVWEAFKRVKANQGAAGVDEQSIEDFEARLAGQPLQALEPAVVGQLHARAGPPGGHTEGKRRNAAVGYPDGRRPCRAGGGPTIPGAAAGTCVPPRLLRLSSRTVGDRCDPDGSPAVLALRLGARHRHQGLLRQHRSRAAAQGRAQAHRVHLGAPLHRALAEGSRDARRGQACRQGPGNAAGWGHLAFAGQPVPALRVR